MQHNGEVQECFKCAQMSDTTTCILLARLLEWTGPAGLIEWREEQVKAAEGDGDIVELKYFLTPLAVGANKEGTEDTEGEEAGVVEIIGGMEVLGVDQASEGMEATGDLDIMEVIWAIKGLEATKAMEAVAAEWQVQPKSVETRTNPS